MTEFGFEFINCEFWVYKIYGKGENNHTILYIVVYPEEMVFL
jgi:hypothetical protein